MALYNGYCALNIFYVWTLNVNLALVSTLQNSAAHSWYSLTEVISPLIVLHAIDSIF